MFAFPPTRSVALCVALGCASPAFAGDPPDAPTEPASPDGAAVAEDLAVFSALIRDRLAPLYPGRTIPEPLANRVAGVGAVFQLELPPPAEPPKPVDDEPAECPYTSQPEWERVRLEVTGGLATIDCTKCHVGGTVGAGTGPIPATPPAGPTRAELTDTLDTLLREHARNLRMLTKDESVAVGVTFRAGRTPAAGEVGFGDGMNREVATAALATLYEQRGALTIELSTLKDRFGSEHPKVRIANQQLDAVSEEIDRLEPRGVTWRSEKARLLDREAARLAETDPAEAMTKLYLAVRAEAEAESEASGDESIRSIEALDKFAALRGPEFGTRVFGRMRDLARQSQNERAVAAIDEALFRVLQSASPPPFPARLAVSVRIGELPDAGEPGS